MKKKRGGEAERGGDWRRSVFSLSGVMKSVLFFFSGVWALQGLSSLPESESERFPDKCLLKNTLKHTHICGE